MPVSIGVLEGLLRFRDEATSQLNRFASHLEQVGNKMKKTGDDLSRVGSGLTRTLTLPLLAVSGYSIKAASDFESSFAGVRKTVNATEAEFAELEKGLRALAAGPTPIPIDVNVLNAIAESAGQLGIAREDILSFTRTMADLGETTNLTSLEAAEASAQFQNIFGQAGKEVDRFGSTLVALGNAGASTERDIISMGVRIAGAGKQIGLTQGEVLAVASALSSVGIEAEAGGSAISKVLIDMSLAVVNGGRELTNFATVAKMSAKDFQTAFRDDAAGALNEFIKGLADVGGEEALRVLDQMGISEVRMRDALLRAAGAGDLLRESLDLQARAWKENNALTDEAAKRYQTFDSQLKIVWNRIKDQAITFGTALLPILRNVLDSLQPLIDKLAELAKWFSELPASVQTTALAVAALAAAAGPLLVVVGSLVTAWGSVAAMAPTLAGAFSSTLAFITGPAGWIAAGVALLLSIKPVREELLKLASDIAGQVTSTISQIRSDFSSWVSKNRELIDSLKDLASTIGNDVVRILSTLVKWYADFVRWHVEAVSEVAKGTSRFIAWASSIDVVNKSARYLIDLLKDIYKFSNLITGLNIFNLIGQATGGGKAAPFKFEPLGLQSGKKEADELAKSLKGLEGQATGTGNGLNILSEDAEKLGQDLSRIRAEYAEQKRYLMELSALASKGPGLDTATRIKQEQRINDEHEYRLDLLSKQEQFGKKIGKEFADMEKSLKKLDREIQTKLKISLKLDEIDVDFSAKNTQIIATDQAMQDLLTTLGQIETVARANAEAFAANRQAYDDWYDDLTEGIRESFKTSRERLEEYKNAVIEAHERGGASALTAAEMEKELASIREQSLMQTLDDWQTFFGFLGNMFGGFAQQIAQAFSNIQAAYAAGKKLDSSGFSAAMGMGGAMGGMLATFQIFYEIYKGVSASIKRDKARTWSDVTTLDTANGQMAPSYFDQYGKEVSVSLVNMLRELIDSIGAVLKDLPEIVIRSRKDGKEFSAYVAGIWVGTFRDAQSALEAAVASAITQADFAFLSKEFAIVLKKSVGATLDELERNLETARSARNARLGDAGSQYVDVSDHYRQEIAAAERLGLATEDLIKARDRELRALINNALGIDTTVSDMLRDLGSLNRGIAESGDSYAAQMQQMIDATLAQIAAMEANGPGPRNTHPIGEDGPGAAGLDEGTDPWSDVYGPGYTKDAQSDWDRALAELRRQLAQYIDELNKIPKALSDQELSMGVFNALYKYLEDSPKYAKEAVKWAKIKVEIEFATIKAQLIALGKWEEFATMFDDAYRAAMAAAGKKPGGGRGIGGGERDSARDFVADRRFELSLSGMTDYQRAMAELDKQYEELFKQAGKDHKLRQELIDLKAEEIRLMQQQQRQSTVTSFQGFLGIGTDQFSQVRKTAEELIKQIEDSPFGDPRKARMIGRVMEEVDRQVTALSNSMAVGLFGQMIADLENAGLKETDLAEARKAMVILEHAIKVENYRTELELLRAQGKLAPQVMKALDDAFKIFSNLDPTAGLNTKYDKTRNRELMQARAAEAAGTLADALKKARESLKKYQDQGIDPLREKLIGIVSDFTDIRRMLGDTPEVMRAYARAINRTIDEFLDPIREVQRDLFYGEGTVADTMTQWGQVQKDFAEMQAQFRAGNLKVVDDIPDMVQQMLGIAQQVVPVGSQAYKEIFINANKFLNEVLALKPENLGTIGNPMTVAGVGDLTALSSAQLSALDNLYRSSERIADALDLLNDKAGYNGGLGNVA